MKILRRILVLFLVLIVGALGIFYRNNGKLVFGVQIEDVNTHGFDNYQDIKAIDVDLELNELIIEASDKPMIEVEYPVYKDKDLQIVVAQEGNTLRICRRDNKKLINIAWPSFNEDQSKTIIRIPKNHALEDLKLQLNMGELRLNDIHSAKTKLTLNMGSLKATQSKLGALNADLDMGSVDFEEVELSGDSKFELDMGSFNGSMKVGQGHVRMDVSMGSVDLQMYDGHYKYKTDVSMGDVKLKNTDEGSDSQDYDAVIEIDVSMGDITVKE